MLKARVSSVANAHIQLILCSINDINNYTKRNRRTQKYYVITSRYALLQGYMRVGYSPQYIYIMNSCFCICVFGFCTIAFFRPKGSFTIINAFVHQKKRKMSLVYQGNFILPYLMGKSTVKIIFICISIRKNN